MLMKGILTYSLAAAGRDEQQDERTGIDSS